MITSTLPRISMMFLMPEEYLDRSLKDTKGSLLGGGVSVGTPWARKAEPQV